MQVITLPEGTPITFTKSATYGGHREFQAQIGDYDDDYFAQLTIRQALKGDNYSWQVVNG